MFLRSTAVFLLLGFALFSSAKSGTLTDKAADFIGTNRIDPPSNNTDNKAQFSKEVESGCQWRGTAPVCDGSCIGWEVEERNSSSSEEEIFGEPCWTGEKAFCCLQNDQDSEWAGLWQSAQTGDIFICFVSCDLNCGKFSCTNFLTSQRAIAQIEGNCDRITFFGRHGTKENGKITWKKHGEQVNTWYKASIDKLHLYV